MSCDAADVFIAGNYKMKATDLDAIEECLKSGGNVIFIDYNNKDNFKNQGTQARVKYGILVSHMGLFY